MGGFEINLSIIGERIGAGYLTFDRTSATGWNPLQNPTLFGPVSSYGMHGCVNAALATEWFRG